MGTKLDELSVGDKLTVTNWHGPPLVVTGKNEHSLFTELDGKKITFTKETTEKWYWKKIS